MTMCSAESTAADPGIGGPSPSLTIKTPDTTNRNPNRRSNKPIMEKRRRARINNCLNELKGILLEAMRKDPARHSKLEKADILELTVSHLKALHRQHGSSSSTLEGTSRFRAGFSECAAEVSRFISSSSVKLQGGGGLDQTMSTRLLGHLADCISNPNLLCPGSNQSQLDLTSPSHSHMLVSSSDHYLHQHSLSSLVPPNTPVISLVPSRLSSGEIAFVVPTSLSRVSSSSTTPSTSISIHSHGGGSFLSPEVPLELTVVPSSSSSSSSSSSIDALSGGSLSPNFVSISRHQYHGNYTQSHNPFSPNQPLALVTPKKECQDGLDGSCWRPWW